MQTCVGPSKKDVDVGMLQQRWSSLASCFALLRELRVFWSWVFYLVGTSLCLRLACATTTLRWWTGESKRVLWASMSRDGTCLRT